LNAKQKEEREILSDLALKGEHKTQRILNALILLGCDAGEVQKQPFDE
jgi:hypothetical protein